MTDSDALLAAILANPEDDTPRLVFADWLEEHADDPCPRCNGEGRIPIDDDGSWQSCPNCHKTGRVIGYAERAEFIRVQCALHDLTYAVSGGDKGWHEQVDALRRREGELLLFGRESWYGKVVGDLVMARGKFTFRRGFVSSISLTLAQFLGGPCGRCEGSGIAEVLDRPFGYEGHGTWPGPCPGPCKGDRAYRTPGLAGALFAAAPIEEVRLTDREPQEYPLSYGDRAVYGWCKTRPGEPFNLPAFLFDELECDDIRGVWKDFPTCAAAVDALSDRLVAYGRANAAGH